MSDVDIPKGSMWWHELGVQLTASDTGILCLTPESLPSPFLNFEAGALSGEFGEKRVCPYLFDLKQPGVSPPLSQFQMTEATREDTKKLIGTINGNMMEPLDESQLSASFDKWWPELEAKLDAVPPRKSKPAEKRSQPEILEEILALVRQLDRKTQSPEEQIRAFAATLNQPEIISDPRRRGRLAAALSNPYSPSYQFGPGPGLLVEALGAVTKTEEPKKK